MHKTNITAATWTTAYVDSLPNSSFAYVEGDTRKLPYKDADGKVNLPHVRNALARLNQTQGIPDAKKAAIKTSLQNALKNAKASDDVLFQAYQAVTADATTQQLPSRMMLLRAGNFYTQKYGEVPLDTSDLKEMADNFKNGIGMAADGTTGLPVDFAHQSHLNAGAWIKDLAVEGDELWATDIEWSKSGREAILNKEYKMLSSDFYPKAFGEWVDPESGVVAQNVIVGAAFTNRPMFTGNQPVVASESSPDGKETNKTVYVISAQSEKENNMNKDELVVKDPKDLTGEQYKFLADNKAELSADERTKFGLQAAEGEAEAKEADGKKPAVKAADVKGDEGKVVVEASDIKAMQDSIKGLQTDAAKRERAEVEADVKKHVARGAIKADRVTSWTDRILAATGKDREEIMADLAAVPDNPLLAGEAGSGDGEEGDGSDPRTKLMNKAIEKVNAAQKDGKTLDINEAVSQVKQEDPTLAEEAASAGQARVAASGATATADQLKAAGVNAG